MMTMQSLFRAVFGLGRSVCAADAHGKSHAHCSHTERAQQHPSVGLLLLFLNKRGWGRERGGEGGGEKMKFQFP